MTFDTELTQACRASSGVLLAVLLSVACNSESPQPLGDDGGTAPTRDSGPHQMLDAIVPDDARIDGSSHDDSDAGAVPPLVVCDAIEARMLSVVADNRQCVEDADCIVLHAECTLHATRDHCSGYYTNTTTLDAANFQVLDEELSQCHYAQLMPDTQHHCGGCLEKPTMPECRSGLCEATPLPEGSRPEERHAFADCNAIEARMLSMIADNRQCVADADCVVLRTECTLHSTRHHCSGGFFVNTTLDAAYFQVLDEELSQCHYTEPMDYWDTGYHCGGCAGAPNAPECRSGLCEETDLTYFPDDGGV